MSDKPGLFERAGSGTVFLDEIGELPLPMQVKLLRVLQERRVRRVGGAADLDVDCRVLAATNRELEKEVATGGFREDLFFRLNVIQLRLPALRERRADIPLLADGFVAKFAEQQQSKVTGLTTAAMGLLTAWHWPGNVRELENVMERAVTLASSERLDVDALPPAMQVAAQSVPPRPAGPLVAEIPPEGLSLDSVLEDYERMLLEKALAI